MILHTLFKNYWDNMKSEEGRSNTHAGVLWYVNICKPSAKNIWGFLYHAFTMPESSWKFQAWLHNCGVTLTLKDSKDFLTHLAITNRSLVISDNINVQSMVSVDDLRNRKLDSLIAISICSRVLDAFCCTQCEIQTNLKFYLAFEIFKKITN